MAEDVTNSNVASTKIPAGTRPNWNSAKKQQRKIGRTTQYKPDQTLDR